MAKGQLRCDLNYWNLDALELARKIKAEGVMIVKTVQGEDKEDFRDVTRLAVSELPSGSLQLFYLSTPARAIKQIDLSSMKVTRSYPWKPGEELIDIVMHAGSLYMLLKLSGNYYVRCFRVAPNLLLPDTSDRLIDSHHINARSRLRIGANGTSLTAYIGPQNNTRFLCLDFGSNETRVLSVDVVDGDKALSPDLDFCVDGRKGTLVIADTQHHRILEVDAGSGKASVICGTGKPGNAAEGQIARNAPLRFPTSLTIYDPKEHIKSDLLNNTYLNADRTKPRTILIGDSGNFRIKKLIEVPFIFSQEFHLPEEPFLYTLLGSGEDVGEKLPKPGKRHKQDLRAYSISKPSAVMVTSLGELVVYCPQAKSFIILKPATAMSKSQVKQSAKSIHDTP